MNQPILFHRASRLILTMALVGPSLAGAADIWVTRYDDPVPGACLPADCSLREAVIAANGSPTVTRIYLSAGTYTLSLPGADEDGALTGDLDLFNRSIEIYGVAANLTVIDASGLDRVFHFWGPALDARLENLTITGGSADSSAAGIYVADGTLRLGFSEIRDNSPGRAIVSWFAHLLIWQSTIANNWGGPLIFGDSQHAENLTMTANGSSGLQLSQGAQMLCWHCTLWATEGYAAIFVSNTDTLLSLSNSAVLGGCTTTVGGAIESWGGNLESPGNGCGLTEPSDQVSVASPGLGGLAMNGGGTRTRVPGLTSPLLGGALDANCLTTDQRGVHRSGLNCDAGAVERAPAQPPTALFVDGFGQGDAEAWSND